MFGFKSQLSKNPLLQLAQLNSPQLALLDLLIYNHQKYQKYKQQKYQKYYHRFQ